MALRPPPKLWGADDGGSDADGAPEDADAGLACAYPGAKATFRLAALVLISEKLRAVPTGRPSMRLCRRGRRSATVQGGVGRAEAAKPPSADGGGHPSHFLFFGEPFVGPKGDMSGRGR